MARIVNQPRLAVVGAGAMSRYHIAAAQRAGFEVVSVCGRPGSNRAVTVANELGIPTVNADLNELADDPSWDAAVIAIDVPETVSVLQQLIPLGKPLLVEKPVSADTTEIRRLLPHKDLLRVAFNRRFYRSSQEAKGFCTRHPDAMILAQIPESLIRDDLDPFLGVRYNSVHVLDLIRFLIGEVQVGSAHHIGSSDDPMGSVLSLRGLQGAHCTVYCVWNSPSNFSLTIDGGVEKLDLRPIELAYRFSGMKVEEPTPERPLRIYSPECVEEIGINHESLEFKPGFLEQMTAFLAFVNGGSGAEDLATLEDAISAQNLANALVPPK